jgi:hypothetical protein
LQKHLNQVRLSIVDHPFLAARAALLLYFNLNLGRVCNRLPRNIVQIQARPTDRLSRELGVG